MKYYIVRHGETEYNINNRCNSDPSVIVSLNDKGKMQSIKVAEKLKETPIAKLFSSELFRCVETARIINEFHGLDIIFDPRLNDRKTGLEGQPVEVFQEEIKKQKDIWNGKLHGGESFEEEKDRVYNFIESTSKLYVDTIVIVTHMEIMNIIHGLFNNLTNEIMWNSWVENCEIHHYER